MSKCCRVWTTDADAFTRQLCLISNIEEPVQDPAIAFVTLGDVMKRLMLQTKSS
jgi:hypothetical protein